MWGQPNAVRDLHQAIAASPSHAYMLVGPRKSGRRTAALGFAAALCCQQPRASGDACGNCGVCRRIARGTFPDVTVVDLAIQSSREKDKTRGQSLNISTVREVGAAVAYRPTEAPWRIYIVDDAETMQETAQEAFLKTLEEPPPYAIIMLLTTDADRLLDTIRSRCTEIRFGRSPDDAIESALRANGILPTLIERIVPHANGSVGWAMDAARDPGLVDERATQRESAVGLVAAAPYDRMIAAIHLADSWSGDRAMVNARLDSLLSVWRGLLLHRFGLASGITQLAGVERLDVAQITGAIASVDQCRQSLEANVRPRLALESMVAAWPPLSPTANI